MSASGYNLLLRQWVYDSYRHGDVATLRTFFADYLIISSPSGHLAVISDIVKDVTQAETRKGKIPSPTLVLKRKEWVQTVHQLLDTTKKEKEQKENPILNTTKEIDEMLDVALSNHHTLEEEGPVPLLEGQESQGEEPDEKSKPSRCGLCCYDCLWDTWDCLTNYLCCCLCPSKKQSRAQRLKTYDSSL